jgi:hypothetical protein
MLQHVGVIDGGAAIRYLDVPPPFKRSKRHEQIGRAIALILIIGSNQTSLLHRDRFARVGQQLFGRLVQTNQRSFGVARTLVHIKHILHRRYERATLLRWNDPLLFEMRLKFVFFRTRPMVLSLA